jgi:DNA-binding response OmpR family regulator
LVVEDDPDINALLKKIVARAGYSCVQAYSGTEARLLIDSEQFDLILLDLMLPGITGEELISYIRTERKLAVPIIAISAKATTSSKVEVLGAGADDYITKPFDTEEVVARIEAALRRTRLEPQQDGTHSYRGLQLNSGTRRVLLKGEDIAFTAHEFDLLEILIQHPDTVFPRERLYQMIWGGSYYGNDNTINVHVSNIRKKLATVSEEEYLQTIWGIGFKLI